MANNEARIVMEEVTDPQENAAARARRERFDRNSAWLQAHAKEVYSRYRGKCVVIAGEELFAAVSSSARLLMSFLQLEA